jgi:Tol biopolymer transport system component
MSGQFSRALLGAGLAALLAACGSAGGGGSASPAAEGAGNPAAGSTTTTVAGPGPIEVAFGCRVTTDDGQEPALCLRSAESGGVVALGSSFGLSVGPSWNPRRDPYLVAYVCKYRRMSAHQIWPTSEAVDLGFSGTSRNQGGEICVADGDHDVKVLTDTHQRANSPAWSPDGTQLAFAVGAGPVIVGADQSDDGSTLGPGIYVITQNAQVAVSKARGDDFPAWSPDGTHLAITSDRGIAVMKADGSDRRQLTAGRWFDFGPQWSPDGSLIAFSRYPLGSPPHREVWVMKPDGSEARMLVRFGGGFNPNVAYEVTPAWSPDGTQLAVAGVPDDSDSYALSVLVVDVATASTQVVSPDPAPGSIGSYSPSWSPDGRWVLFGTNRADGGTGITIVRPDGSEIHDERAVDPTFASDVLVFDPVWG